MLDRDPSMAIPDSIMHFGPIASGDTVMKSGASRDRIAKEIDVIGFEMEGVGVSETWQNVVVIKGVCDYADSHKDKKWQRHAAATAAACMRAVLAKMEEEIPESRRSRRARFRSSIVGY
jgi:nucleoside phosphorylase